MFKLYINNNLVWETTEPVGQVFASSPHGKATFRLEGGESYIKLILLNPNGDKVQVRTVKAEQEKLSEDGEDSPLVFGEGVLNNE